MTTARTKIRAAQCGMVADCTQPVTHIGEKGFVYCARHVTRRRGVERCRKMRKWEINLVNSGKALPSYKVTRKPRALAMPETDGGQQTATKEKPVCPECGSDNISADAAVRWSVETQQWEVTNVFDKGKTCDDCEAEFSEPEWKDAES